MKKLFIIIILMSLCIGCEIIDDESVKMKYKVQSDYPVKITYLDKDNNFKTTISNDWSYGFTTEAVSKKTNIKIESINDAGFYYTQNISFQVIIDGEIKVSHSYDFLSVVVFIREFCLRPDYCGTTSVTIDIE